MAERGTFKGEVERAWRSFWGASWKMKGPVIAGAALVLMGAIASAGGSEKADDNKAAAAEVTVEATATPKPTETPKPTAIPTTTPIPATPTRTIAERQKLMTDLFASADMLTVIEADAVNLARVANGRLELEYRARWASRERQPQVSYKAVQMIAEVMATWTPEVARLLLGESPGVFITTYSSDGDYRYQSFTDFPTIKLVASKSITYAEWVTASGAGFK